MASGGSGVAQIHLPSSCLLALSPPWSAGEEQQHCPQARGLLLTPVQEETPWVVFWAPTGRHCAEMGLIQGTGNVRVESCRCVRLLTKAHQPPA